MSIFPTTLLQKLPKLTFITGKGGTGKTFIAAALAQELQKSKTVALITNSHIDQLGPLFGTTCQNGATKKAAGVNLFNLSTKDNINLFIEKKFSGNFIIKKTVNSKVFYSFLNTVPGIKELVYLGHILYLANLDTYDHVIVDSYATGHFLTMVQSPSTLGKLDFTGRLFQDLRRFHQQISDHKKTGVIVVSNPEDLIVKESEELIDKISKDLKLNFLKHIINKAPQRNLRTRSLQVEDYGFIHEPLDLDALLNQSMDSAP